MCMFKCCHLQLYLPITTVSAHISRFRSGYAQKYIYSQLAGTGHLPKNTHVIENRFSPANCSWKQTCDTLNYSIIRFRTRNHRLPIETGSWSGIKSVERKCQLCKCSSSIADEFHYLLECKSLENERKRYTSNP